jgi:SWI/SNF-related matrix-associated actin-dependent regulator 1 of chromatin subfamily A
MFKKLCDLRTLPQNIDDDGLEEFQKKAEYMALWKRTAEIKLPSMLEYVDDLLDAGHKMLIFAHHQTIIDCFEGHLLVKKVRFIRIDGRTATSSRQELCNAFQTDPSMRVAVLSLTAASTGLTLTAATTVIFAELFWNPGLLLQAEDRAHRIGQSDSVNVHYLLAKGTTDDSIWPLIMKKLTMLESVGLGKNDFKEIRKEDHDPAQLKIDTFIKKRSLQESE